jgi:hypothetical protein
MNSWKEEYEMLYEDILNISTSDAWQMLVESSVTNVTVRHFQIAFSEFDVNRICAKITSYWKK